jgi:tRNA A37 threonylcarbamoyladenosine modification protein TsaB
MASYQSWPSPIENLLEAAAAAKPAKGAGRARAAAIDTSAIEKQLADLAAKVASLEKDVTALKQNQQSLAGSGTGGSSLDTETRVLDGILENEYTDLDDVKEFVDDMSEAQFKSAIKRLYLFKVIDGKESNSNIQVEVAADGLKIGQVKRK